MTNEGDGFIKRVMTILQAAKMNQRDLSTTKGRLGKLEMKLEAEHHHRANMTAAKTSYQHSVSERNKLIMGKIQNESNDMRVRMQTMLLGSAPESAKAAEQQQQTPQNAPMQEGFVEAEESETKDAEMKETCNPPSPTRRKDKRAPDESPATLKRTEARTTQATPPTEGVKKAKEAPANEEEGGQAYEDMSIDPRMLDEEFRETLKVHEASVSSVEQGNGSRSAVSAKLNKFMQKILPGAEVEELKEKTLSLRLQLFKERISGASAANIARMATAAMGLSSMEGAHGAKPMMYGTVEVTWSDAYQIPIMNVTPIEDQNFAEEFSELQLPTAIVTMIMLTIFTAITAASIFQAIQSRSKRIKLGSKDADTHEATCLLIGFGFPAILFFTLVASRARWSCDDPHEEASASDVRIQIQPAGVKLNACSSQLTTNGTRRSSSRALTRP
jgi:hypothetical protein